MTFDREQITLNVGQVDYIHATILPFELAEEKLEWKSSNESAVTVSRGRITAVSEGTSFITATAENGKYATCYVVVLGDKDDAVGDDNNDNNGNNDNDDNNNGGNSTVATGAYDGSAVTITFWHTMGSDNRTLLENAIARFNETYPNIKVEALSYGDYEEVFTQIRTKMLVGKQPNMAFCYPDHVATYNKAGAVLTLDELINNTNVVWRNNILKFSCISSNSRHFLNKIKR